MPSARLAMLEMMTWEYAGIEPAAIPIPAGKMFPIPARRISAMFKFDIDARIRLLYHGFQMSENRGKKWGRFPYPVSAQCRVTELSVALR